MTAKAGAFALSLAAVCGTMMSAAPQCRADVFSTFDLSGNFGEARPSGFNVFSALSGSVTVDTTTGVIAYQTVFTSTNPGLPVTFTQGFDTGANAYFLNVFGTIRDANIFFNAASLVDYTGGTLGSLATPTVGGKVSTFGAQLLPLDIVLQSGTAIIEAVPEPSSIALFGAVLGGLALAFRIRRAR